MAPEWGSNMRHAKPMTEQEEQQRLDDRKAKFDWMKEAVNKLAQDFNKQFPKSGGEYKYFLFNSVRWD